LQIPASAQQKRKNECTALETVFEYDKIDACETD